MDIQSRKKQARDAAFARRKAAFASQSYDLTPDLLDLVKGYQVIACYMAMRTEIDPKLAMHALTKAGKQVAVPIILGAGQPLVFHEWTPDCEMVEGEFGAFIPKGTHALTPEFVLAPMVAYDAQGTRLGYGGGFYDRTLEKLRNLHPTPYIGLAFEEQKSDTPLPAEPTDIPLDGILTQNGYQDFSPSNS